MPSGYAVDFKSFDLLVFEPAPSLSATAGLTPRARAVTISAQCAQSTVGLLHLVIVLADVTVQSLVVLSRVLLVMGQATEPRRCCVHGLRVLAAQRRQGHVRFRHGGSMLLTRLVERRRQVFHDFLERGIHFWVVIDS